MMLTYSFPALVLGVLETGVALTLLGPLSLARPSMQLCKLTTKPVGKTILGTLTALLSALLLPPLWELFSLNQRHYPGEMGSLRYREAESTATLNAITTAACLVLTFTVQKLGLTLLDRELQKMKERTLLKQVESQRRYYEQQDSARAAASPAQAEAKASGPRELEGLRERVAEMQESLAAAQKDKKRAESNAEALKSQSRGLESEYDRLLAAFNKLEGKQETIMNSSRQPASRFDKKDA